MPEQLTNQTNDLAIMLSRIQAAEQSLGAKRSEVPMWVWDNYIPIRHSRTHSAMWEVGLPIEFQIKEIIYNDIYLHTVPQALQKWALVQLWLPIDQTGKYTLTHLHTEMEVNLPHVYGYSACLAIGDGPPRIATYSDYTSLMRSLKRAMGQINLSSLLTKRPSKWPKEVRLAIVPAIRKWIRRRQVYMPREVLETYFIRQASETKEETWTQTL